MIIIKRMQSKINCFLLPHVLNNGKHPLHKQRVPLSIIHAHGVEQTVQESIEL